jgi:hypothetical protein
MVIVLALKPPIGDALDILPKRKPLIPLVPDIRTLVGGD